MNMLNVNSPTVLEAGKKYTNTHRSLTDIFYCIGKNTLGQTIMENCKYSGMFVAETSCNWKEYVEPKGGKAWINVYQMDFGPVLGRPYDKRKDADAYKGIHRRLACISVVWTEGQGL